MKSAAQAHSQPFTIQDLQSAKNPLEYFIRMLSFYLEIDEKYFRGTNVSFETAVAKLLGIQDNQVGAMFNVTGLNKVQIELTLNYSSQEQLDNLKEDCIIPNLIVSTENHLTRANVCKIVMDAELVLMRLLPLLKAKLKNDDKQAGTQLSKDNKDIAGKQSDTKSPLPDHKIFSAASPLPVIPEGLVSASTPKDIKIKAYQFDSCFDGKIGFEKRRYPDEHLILQMIYAYCKEIKLDDRTVLHAGRALPKHAGVLFKDKIVLDGETMFWDEKSPNTLRKPLDLIIRFNYFKQLGDNKPRLYFLVFHWGYHHGFFVADFKKNSYLYLDPQGHLLQQRGAQSDYKNMFTLMKQLQSNPQHVVLEYLKSVLQSDFK